MGHPGEILRIVAQPEGQGGDAANDDQEHGRKDPVTQVRGAMHGRLWRNGPQLFNKRWLDRCRCGCRFRRRRFDAGLVENLVEGSFLGSRPPE